MVRKSLWAAAVTVLAVSAPALAQYITTPRPEPNTAAPPTAARSGDRLIITARNGQTEQQQWSDRYECHRWAKDQSSFDPTIQPPEGLTASEIASRRDQYRRAFTACLEGKGYAVHYGETAAPVPVPAPAARPAPTITARHYAPAEPELRYHPIEGQFFGGYTVSTGKTDRLLDDGANVGFGLTWFPTSALPVGIRVDGSYTTLDAKNAFLNQFGSNVYRAEENIYGGDADLQLDLAHSSSRSKFYLFGGAGWYREQTHLRSVTFGQGTVCGFFYCQQGTFPFRSTQNVTTAWRSAWNAGLGWEIAYADGASFFIEARYLQIAPQDSKLQFVPIRVGLRF
jgi:opacity protein-like surface antigen